MNGFLLIMVYLCSISASSIIDYRLPKVINPLYYTVLLEPTLDGYTEPAPFTGYVLIQLQMKENSKNITLHALNLHILKRDIYVYRRNGSEINVVNTTVDLEKSFFTIHLESGLQKNSIYRLVIQKFDGFLQNSIGFFLGKEYDDEGNERRYAATHFQPTFARAAFPCFDEPHLKAHFTVQLIRGTNYTSLSNQPLIHSRDLGNGRYMDTYKATEKISSYLVAFVISNYAKTPVLNKQTIYANPRDIFAGHANFALKISSDIYEALRAFLNVTYDIQKLDDIAISSSYIPSAAENYGLATYQKPLIVYPIQQALSREKQSTAIVIAHAISHQWFGNLVTCSWWQYYWLNEGFAMYFAYFGAALANPEWGFMDRFIIQSLHPALILDSLDYTIAMNEELTFPSLPQPLAISFNKGAAIIRMIEQFVTPEIFKQSIKRYLEDNKYAAVEPSALYEAIQKTIDQENKTHLLEGLTIAGILQSWDSQKGYPVVSVTRDDEYNSMILYQTRFRLPSNAEQDYTVWNIPITFCEHHYLLPEPKIQSLWMTSYGQEVALSSHQSSWIILNVNQTGFYRVNYEERNWKRIIYGINQESFSNISVTNRAQLLDDSFNLARAGQLNYHIPFELSTYLTKETNYLPLTSFLGVTKFLDTMLTTTSAYEKFQVHMRFVLNSNYRRLGIEEKAPDDHLTKLNRIDVIDWFCKVGGNLCREECLGRLRSWTINDQNKISPDLEQSVLCGALRIGDMDVWDFVYQQYENEKNNAGRKGRILNALGCSQNRNIIERFLEKILKNSTLRKTEGTRILQAIHNGGNGGLSMVLDFIEKNYDILNTASVNIPKIFYEICGKIISYQQLEMVLNAFRKYNVQHFYEFSSAIQEAQENVQWAENYIDVIAKWMNDNY